MSNNQLRNIIENYIDAFNNYDIDKLVNQFTETGVYEVASNLTEPVICHGKEKIRELTTNTRAIFTSRTQQVTNWIINENKAAIEFNYVAIVTNDLPNGLKAGQKLALRGISIYEFENGKIKRLMDFG